MVRQPKWDKFEAALLIETYWDIRNGKISRKEAAASLSKLLRDRMPENEIDETYRNENGINMRLGEIDALFNDGKGGLTNTSELFREMVSMYNTDQKSYEEILKEAHGMNGNTSIKASFKTWLSAKYPKAVFDVVCFYIKTAEEFCVKVKVLKRPLLETVEAEVLKRVYKTITENKIFRIVNKKQHQRIVEAVSWYIAFVKSEGANLVNKGEGEKKATDEATKAKDSVEPVETAPQGSYIVDFDNLTSLAFTKPLSYTYKGTTSSAIKNWTDLYVKLFSQIYEEFGASIPVNRSFYGSGRSDFGDGAKMTAPKQIVGNYYLETNISATDIVKKIAALMDICDIAYSDVIIRYEKRGEGSAEEKKNESVVVSENGFDAQFGSWLSDSEHMAPGTCRSYVSAIHVAESFASNHGYENAKIASNDWEAAMAVIAQLVIDPQFLEFNRVQHNRFSAAFQKLAKFYDQLNPGHGIVAPALATGKKPAKEDMPRIEVSAGLRDEINAYLKAATDGISKPDLLEHFGQYSTRQINAGLEECHAVYVLKKYYSKDNISDYDEMAEVLLEILLKQFSSNGGYTSAQQLYNEAHARLDDFFFYNNAFESRPEVFDLAAHLFEQEHYKGYSFIFNSGTHIWKEEPDYPKDYHGLLIKYAREHQNVFSREDAAGYFEWIGSTTPQQTLSNVFANTGSQTFLQYAENQFVLTEALGINDAFLSGVGTQIRLLLEGDDYIAFGEIDDYFYTTLPGLPANICWSPLLLADIIRMFDIGYMIMEAGNDNDMKTIPAAIVKTNSPFKTFGDIVWYEVQKDFSLPKEFTSGEFREFLLMKGFIHGSEKMWSVHKTVADDIRFYWTNKNGKVTIN